MHTATLNRLLRNIRSDDSSVRRSAAEALAEGDERALYPLIRALKDDNLGVQDAAMRSLMELKNETTAYMVLPLLRENAFLRNTALIILKELGAIAVPLLAILLNDRDDDIRKFALDLIHDIEYCSYPEKLVAMLTEDSNTNVRAAAAKTLGRLQYKKAVPQLVKALDDEEWVCFSALEALTEFQDSGTDGNIIRLLEHHSETIRFAAIEALGKLRSPEAVSSLKDHIARSEGFERTAIIKSLAMTGSIPDLPGVAEALTDMLLDEDWDDKTVAIQGLTAMHHGAATRPMLEVAGSVDTADPESEERMYLIRDALVRLAGIPILIAALDDHTLKYRAKVVAIEVLGDLKCREAVKALINVLKCDYRDVRRSSIKSLGNIESKEARQCLLEAIGDHDSHVRKSAVMALGKIGEPSAFEPLMKMLSREQYRDVLDEFIIALVHIDADLLSQRVHLLREDIQTIAREHLNRRASGATC